MLKYACAAVCCGFGSVLCLLKSDWYLAAKRPAPTGKTAPNIFFPVSLFKKSVTPAKPLPLLWAAFSGWSFFANSLTLASLPASVNSPKAFLKLDLVTTC